jgi:hypothetical protein
MFMGTVREECVEAAGVATTSSPEEVRTGWVGR